MKSKTIENAYAKYTVETDSWESNNRINTGKGIESFNLYSKARKQIDDAEKEQELLAFNMGYRTNNIGR